MIHIPLFIQILLWIIADLLIGILLIKAFTALLHSEKIHLRGITEVLLFIVVALFWPISITMMIRLRFISRWPHIQQRLKDIDIKF